MTPDGTSIDRTNYIYHGARYMRHNATPDIDLLSDQSHPDLELPPDLDPVTGDTLSDPYPIPDDEQERDLSLIHI